MTDTPRPSRRPAELDDRDRFVRPHPGDWVLAGGPNRQVRYLTDVESAVLNYECDQILEQWAREAQRQREREAAAASKRRDGWIGVAIIVLEVTAFVVLGLLWAAR